MGIPRFTKPKTFTYIMLGRVYNVLNPKTPHLAHSKHTLLSDQLITMALWGCYKAIVVMVIKSKSHSKLN